MYRTCPHCRKSNKSHRTTCWNCENYMGPAKTAGSGPLYGRAARAELGAAVFRNPDDEDEDEDWPEDPHHSKWADSTYAWRKNPEDSEEDVDEDEEFTIPEFNTPPSLHEDEDDEEIEDEDEVEVDEDEVEVDEDEVEVDEDEVEVDEDEDETSWEIPSLSLPVFDEDEDEEIVADADEEVAVESAHYRRRRRRRNPKDPYNFSHGKEIAEQIFSGGNPLYRNNRLRRRNPYRKQYYKNPVGRGVWGSTLYPETGGNWGQPLYRNPCGSDHRKPRRYRRNRLRRRNPGVWGDTLYPETGGNWGEPLYRRNATRGAWGGSLYPKTGGKWAAKWGGPLYRRNASTAAWGSTLYPETGGNWGEPLYRRRRNPAWGDPFAPTKRWEPVMGDIGPEPESIEEELEAAATRRYRRNPRGVWGESLYGGGSGAWGGTLYRRNPTCVTCGIDNCKCGCAITGRCVCRRRKNYRRNS